VECADKDVTAVLLLESTACSKLSESDLASLIIWSQFGNKKYHLLEVYEHNPALHVLNTTFSSLLSVISPNNVSAEQLTG